MSDDLRQRIHLLCQAFEKGNVAVFADALDDDVEFQMHAPPELFPYLGQLHGKAAMMDAVRNVLEEFEFERYEPISIIAGDGETAAIIRTRARERASNRKVELLLIQFVCFRAHKIVEFRQFIDSLQLVEQLLGRKFDLSR
jgi:ketosteroid isomerase-like protein